MDGEREPAEQQSTGTHEEAATTRTAPTAPEGTAAVAAAQAPRSKDRALKVVIGICACAVAAALAVGAFLIVSILDDNAAKARITQAFQQDEGGILSSIVIPSEWGDQDGFSFEAAQMLSFERDWVSSPDRARATVRITAGNGHYELLDDFALVCQKGANGWDIERPELLVERYEPTTAIPDEVLIANLSALIEAADASNAELARTQAHMLSNVFGTETVATVDENEMADGTDHATLTLSTSKDGRDCTGRLETAFSWTEQPDGSFDWDLEYAMADDETTAMAGSFPHEGMSYFDDDEEASEAENLRPAYGEYYMMYLERLRVLPGTNYVMIGFENIPHNDVDLAMTVVRSDTNETLYESPRIGPNTSIDTFELPGKLEPGEYPIELRITGYERGTGRLAGTKTFSDIVLSAEE